MSNILSKIPNLLSDEDSEIVKQFLETEERIHKMHDLMKENKKKEKIRKKKRS